MLSCNRQTGEGLRVLIHVWGESSRESLSCPTLGMAQTRRPAITSPMDSRSLWCTMSRSLKFWWCTTGLYIRCKHFHHAYISMGFFWRFLRFFHVITGSTVLRLHTMFPPGRERTLWRGLLSWISLWPTNWLGFVARRMSKLWSIDMCYFSFHSGYFSIRCFSWIFVFLRHKFCFGSTCS